MEASTARTEEETHSGLAALAPEEETMRPKLAARSSDAGMTAQPASLPVRLAVAQDAGAPQQATPRA
jgi:hypothetical protein